MKFIKPKFGSFTFFFDSLHSVVIPDEGMEFSDEEAATITDRFFNVIDVEDVTKTNTMSDTTTEATPIISEGEITPEVTPTEETTQETSPEEVTPITEEVTEETPEEAHIAE